MYYDEDDVNVGPSFGDMEMEDVNENQFPIDISVSDDDLTGIKVNEQLKAGKKFERDYMKNIKAKKYFQPQYCSLCSVYSEYKLAKYENGDGQKLCPEHMETVLNESPEKVHDVEKIEYGRTGKIGVSRKVDDPELWNDFDRRVLQSRGNDSISVKFLVQSELCEKCKTVMHNAMYYVEYIDNSSSEFLCLDHAKVAVLDYPEDVKRVYKLYVKKKEEETDHDNERESPKNKKVKNLKEIDIVNIDMDRIDDEGCILISTLNLIDDLFEDSHQLLNAVPFLYRCPNDVAIIDRKGRYKIEDPRHVSEHIKTGSDPRSGSVERYVASGKDGDESTVAYYFNLPRISKFVSKGKPIPILQYDNQIINDDVARKIYRNFVEGTISVQQLDKTKNNYGERSPDKEDFEFWDDLMKFDRGDWKHARKRIQKF
jgi:hypothetical protein